MPPVLQTSVGKETQKILINYRFELNKFIKENVMQNILSNRPQNKSFGKRMINYNISRRELSIKKYNKNPTTCTNCSDVLIYDKRKNKFCSKSCSASYNNKNRTNETFIKQKETLLIISKISQECNYFGFHCLRLLELRFQDFASLIADNLISYHESGIILGLLLPRIFTL